MPKFLLTVYLLTYISLTILSFPAEVKAEIPACARQGVNIATQEHSGIYGDDEKINLTVTVGSGKFKDEVNPKSVYQIWSYPSQNKINIHNGSTREFNIDIKNNTTIPNLELRKNSRDELGNAIARQGGWPIGSYFMYLYKGNSPVCQGPKIEIIPSRLRDAQCSFSVPKNIQQGKGETIDVSITPKSGLEYSPLLFDGKRPLSSFNMGSEKNFTDNIASWVGAAGVGAAGAAAITGGAAAIPGAALGAISGMGISLISMALDDVRLAQVNAKEFIKPEQITGNTIVIDNKLGARSEGYTLAIMAKLQNQGFAGTGTNYGFACGIAYFTVTNNPTSSEMVQSVSGKGAGIAYVKEQNELLPQGEPVSAAGITCGAGKGGAGTDGIQTAIGCIPTKPDALFKGTIKFAVGIAGGISLLLMAFAGLQMVTSGGNPEQLKGARERFQAAILGLLFIIFSVLLLQIISKDILGLPGFS